MLLILEKWLTQQGWEVYKEVQIGRSNFAINDIVAVRDWKKTKLIWTIEGKMSLGHKVVEQAFQARRHSHFVSVATPNFIENLVLDKFCKVFGVGRIAVKPDVDKTFSYTNYMEGSSKNPVHQLIQPYLHRKADTKALLKVLHPEMKKSVAGSKDGGYVTPFSLTILRVKEFLKNKEPQPMKAIIDGIDHHYRTDTTARASIARAINCGYAKGFKKITQGRQTLFTLEDQ